MEYEDECKWLGGIPSKGFCKIKNAFLEDAGVDCEKNLQGKKRALNPLYRQNT